MAAYTTDKLLASINLKSFTPVGQKTFSTSDILSISDEITNTKLNPSILSVREEYFVTYLDIPIIAGQEAYLIPDRSIGTIARDVKILNSNGDLTPLVRLDPGRAATVHTNANTPNAFFLRGNNICLYPIPSVSQFSLRIYYFIRQGELIETSAAAQVSVIDPLTNSVTVSLIPSTWASTNVFDFISGTGSHDYRGIDYTSVTVSGPVLTFNSLPTGLIVGDYIALQGQSPVVQLPPDYRPVLATFVAAELLRVQGMDTAAAIEAKALELLAQGQMMVTPRVVGEDQVILPSWA